MAKNYNGVKKAVLKNVSEFMCTAARTAPKTRGKDNLVISLLSEADKKKVIARMEIISRRDDRPSFGRDAKNLKDVDDIVIIATKKAVLGLDCGFCGYDSCKDLAKTKGTCAYNSMDLGIALGSAVSVASEFHIDNRLMFSIGKTVIELNLLGKNIIQAIGIPMSATGKNPFFDR